MAARSTPALLGKRALNRALLARQFLLRRTVLSPLAVIEHLVGMQSQNPMPPYVGLWTRLEKFEAEQLSSLVLERKVVRIALMRATIHLVTAGDCRGLRRTLQPVLQRHVKFAFANSEVGEAERLAEHASALVRERPRTWAELGALLSVRWPGITTDALARAVRSLLPLVQVPPRGLWASSGPAVHTTADHWLGAAPSPDVPIETIVRRYLAAFGPATVNDVQAWSGLTRLREVLARMKPELLVFRDDAGGELFDVTDAPRPDANAPAPPRFLPEYDNLLLGHADRSRIVASVHRSAVYSRNGIISSTVLVDGFVGATWKIATRHERATLSITPLVRIVKRDRAVIAEEGERLLQFVAPDAKAHEVTFP